MSTSNLNIKNFLRDDKRNLSANTAVRSAIGHESNDSIDNENVSRDELVSDAGCFSLCCGKNTKSLPEEIFTFKNDDKQGICNIGLWQSSKKVMFLSFTREDLASYAGEIAAEHFESYEKDLIKKGISIHDFEVQMRHLKHDSDSKAPHGYLVAQYVICGPRVENVIQALERLAENEMLNKADVINLRNAYNSQVKSTSSKSSVATIAKNGIGGMSRAAVPQAPDLSDNTKCCRIL